MSNIDTQAEVARIESEIADKNKRFNVTLLQHQEEVSQLMYQRSHVVHLGSVMQPAKGGGATEEALSETSSAKTGTAPVTEAKGIESKGTEAPKAKLSPSERRKASRHAKRDAQRAAAAAGGTETTAAKATGGKGRARRAAARTEAAVETQSAAPKGRRSLRRNAAKVQPAAVEAAPEATTQSAVAAPTGGNALSLKALDVLRHHNGPMKSGDIAEQIQAKPRGMGPILSPLTRDGSVTKTSEGLYEAVRAN